ncbi:MAG: hypothetical protein ACYDDF_00290 [Thermoplasmatota archaeon]
MKEGVFLMPFETQGYKLFRKTVTFGGQERPIYFFTKKPNVMGAEAAEVPAGYEVNTNTRSGLPVLQKTGAEAAAKRRQRKAEKVAARERRNERKAARKMKDREKAKRLRERERRKTATTKTAKPKKIARKVKAKAKPKGKAKKVKAKARVAKKKGRKTRR